MTGAGRGRALRRGLLGAGLLGASAGALRSERLQRADVRAGDALRRAGAPPLDLAVTATTDLGSLYAVLGIAGVLGATGRRRSAADAVAIGGAAWAVAQSSKRTMRRARPYESDGVRRLIRPPAGSSFPSGHAAVAAAVTSLLAERARGRAGRVALHGLAAYVAASRVYVGVHYPTDVAGGAGMGLMLSAAWRGPVAAAGRVAVAVAGRATLAAAPLLGRVVLGVRPRRSAGAREPGAAAPRAPRPPSAAPPRSRSAG